MRDLLDLLVDLRSASRSHQAVRAAILAGALLYGIALALAGGGTTTGLVGLAVAAVLVVVQPHAVAPGLFFFLAIGLWLATTDGPWHWALLPASLGLVLLHTAAALCASVPAQAQLPEEVLRTWGARLGLVAAVTTGVWGVAGLLGGATSAALGAVPGIVGLAVLAGGLVAYLRWRGRAEGT